MPTLAAIIIYMGDIKKSLNFTKKPIKNSETPHQAIFLLLVPDQLSNWLLTRYVKLRIAHAPGVFEMFSPPSTSKETAS